MTLIHLKRPSAMQATVLAGILLATAFAWPCSGSSSTSSRRRYDLTGNWEIVLSDGRVSQSTKGTLIESSHVEGPPGSGFGGDTVTDGLLNAYGPSPGTCPQGWPATPPSNTRLDGTVSTIGCILCDSPQFPVNFHVTETDPAQGGLQVADIRLNGVYYGNFKVKSGSWSGTMIACTGMNSSGTWHADRQP
jgi:hypothetical protein